MFKFSYRTKNRLAVLAPIAIAGILFVGLPVMKHNSTESVRVQVTAKEVKAGQESSKYLVFTDKTTYEITDSLLMMRWNSSDIYGRIKVGSCYDFLTRGWRVPFLSMYRNIDSYIEVDCNEETRRIQ